MIWVVNKTTGVLGIIRGPVMVQTAAAGLAEALGFKVPTTKMKSENLRAATAEEIAIACGGEPRKIRKDKGMKRGPRK